MIENYCFWGSY